MAWSYKGVELNNREISLFKLGARIGFVVGSIGILSITLILF